MSKAIASSRLWPSSSRADCLINDDPQHAVVHLAEAHAVAHAERSSYLLHEVYNNEAQAARDVGELAPRVALATELADSRSTLTVSSGVWLLASIGLLAMDEDALRLAVRVAERTAAQPPGFERRAGAGAHAASVH